MNAKHAIFGINSVCRHLSATCMHNKFNNNTKKMHCFSSKEEIFKFFRNFPEFLPNFRKIAWVPPGKLNIFLYNRIFVRPLCVLFDDQQ